MNRPLFAIGVLLAFLAAAMLAVGLASRPSHSPSARGGSGALTARRSVGGPVYLLVVPDADEAVAQVFADTEGETAQGESSFLLPCEQPCYAYGCGLDRSTGLVYSIRPAAQRQNLRPAAIAVVADPISFELANSLDCRAHYDQRYDAAVYGSWPMLREAEGKMGTPPRALPTELDNDDPTLRLFFSLSGDNPASPALLRLKSARQWRLELMQIARGTASEMWLVATRLGLVERWERLAAVVRPQPAAAGPSWADYEAWIASLQPTVADRDTPAAETGIPADQAWRQVLQIAVSWLNHAAKTLGSVAQRLDGWGELTEDDRIGVRSTPDGPR